MKLRRRCHWWLAALLLWGGTPVWAQEAGTAPSATDATPAETAAPASATLAHLLALPEEVPEIAPMERPFSPHLLNYLQYSSGDVQFQFSVKYKMWSWSESAPASGAFFTYTQRSYWGFSLPSRPFLESDYNPGFLFCNNRGRDTGGISGIWRRPLFLGGWEHESNGMSGPTSRSWHRWFGQARLLAWHGEDESGGGFERSCSPTERSHKGQEVSLWLKGWHAYSDAQNPDIQDFYGNGEVLLHVSGRHEFINAAWRHGESGGRQSLRVDASWHLVRTLERLRLDRVLKTFSPLVGVSRREFDPAWEVRRNRNNVYLNVQYWIGYGEWLGTYNQKSQGVSVGLVFPN